MLPWIDLLLQINFANDSVHFVNFVSRFAALDDRELRWRGFQRMKFQLANWFAFRGTSSNCKWTWRASCIFSLTNSRLVIVRVALTRVSSERDFNFRESICESRRWVKFWLNLQSTQRIDSSLKTIIWISRKSSQEENSRIKEKNWIKEKN